MKKWLSVRTAGNGSIASALIFLLMSLQKKILNGIAQVVLINVEYYSIISKYTAFFLKNVLT